MKDAVIYPPLSPPNAKCRDMKVYPAEVNPYIILYKLILIYYTGIIYYEYIIYPCTNCNKLFIEINPI